MQEPVFNCVDDYSWSDSRQVLTSRETEIPQLTTFGHGVDRPSPSTLLPHCHLHKFEIVVVVSGQQIYCVEDELYTVSGGEVFLTFPGEPHSGRELTQSVGEIYWCQIDVTDSRSFFHLQSPWSERLYHRLLRIHNRVCKVSPGAVKLVKKSFSLLASPEPFDKLIGASTFTTFLAEYIANNLAQRRPEPSPAIGKAVAYIREHIGQELLLEQLAAFTGLSLSAFKQRFKEEIGIPPREFINLRKIEQAKLLIRQEPRRSLSDIAMALGFTTSNYFSVVFKKYTGVSPREYSRLSGEEEPSHEDR